MYKYFFELSQPTVVSCEFFTISIRQVLYQLGPWIIHCRWYVPGYSVNWFNLSPVPIGSPGIHNNLVIPNYGFSHILNIRYHFILYPYTQGMTLNRFRFICGQAKSLLLPSSYSAFKYEDLLLANILKHPP